MQAVLSPAQPMPSGAIALGSEGLVAHSPVVTGGNNLLFGGDFTAALQSQLIQQSLQAVLAQAFSAATRPRLEDLFDVIRDPATIPAAFFGAEVGHAFLRPFDLSYTAAGREGKQKAQEQLDYLSPRVLLLGRSGLGRTREAAVYAARLCSEGWTVCVARLQNCRKMGVTDGVLADQRVLIVVDDLHRHIGASSDVAVPYLDRLRACLAEFERDPGIRLRVLLTVPAGLPLEAANGNQAQHPVLRPFQVLELEEFKPEALEILLAAAADGAGVAISGDEITAMVTQSDRTPKTLVANANRAAREGQTLSLQRWQNTAAGTWARAFADVRAAHPAAGVLYQALYLLQEAGVAANLEITHRLGTALSDNDIVSATAAFIRDGLLRLEDSVLYPLAAEQLADTLLATHTLLPDLETSWQLLLETLRTTRLPASTQLRELSALADTLRNRGQSGAAEAVLDAVIVEDPDHEAARVVRGEIRVENGDHSGAIEDFTQAIAGGRDEANVYFLRGLSLLKLGDYAAAESDLTQAIAGGERLAYEARGLARYMQFAMVEAEADLTAALERNQDALYLYRLRGFTRYIQNHLAGAVEDWTRSLEPGKIEPSLLFQRGWAQFEAGNLREAERDLALAREQGMDSPFLLWILGWLRLSLGQLEAADADFTQAIAGWNNDEYLAALQAIAGAMADGETDLETALKNDPVLTRKLLSAFPDLDASSLDTGSIEERQDDDPNFNSFLGLWAKMMQDRLAAHGTDLSAFGQIAALPYQTRGFTRLSLQRFADAEADFLGAHAHGGDAGSVYYGLGLARACQGRMAEAIADLETVINQGQTQANAHFWLGCTRYWLGEPAAAAGSLTEALNHGYNIAIGGALLYAIHNSPFIIHNSSFARGLLAYELNDWATAEATFDAILAAQPDYALAYMLRGWSRFVIGKLALAEADFDAAAIQDPAFGQAYYGRAAARFNQSDFVAAEADYTAALAHGYDNGYVYMERGGARLEQGDLEGADQDLAAAEASGLKTGQLDHIRGWLRFRQERLDEAEADFQTAISQGFAGPVTWYGLAATSVRLKRFAAAAEAYTQAIDRGLALPDVYLERALAHDELGDSLGTEADLDVVIEAGSAAGFIYDHRSLLRFERNEFVGAATDVTAAIDRGEDDLALYLRRGLSRYMLGEFAEAAEDLTTVISAISPESYPEVPLAFQCRAICRVWLGALADAEKDCQTAREMAADDPATHECWAWLHLAQGDYDAALDGWQAALGQAETANNYFGLGLACLLAGRLEESLDQYRLGAATAEPLDVEVAHRDLDHWTARQPARVATAAARATLSMIQQMLVPFD